MSMIGEWVGGKSGESWVRVGYECLFTPQRIKKGVFGMVGVVGVGVGMRRDTGGNEF